MEEISNDELLSELKSITEEWRQLLEESKRTKQLPATYYMKFSSFVKYMNIGRDTAKKIVRAAEAIVWIDKVQMINVAKVHEYLDSINE